MKPPLTKECKKINYGTNEVNDRSHEEEKFSSITESCYYTNLILFLLFCKKYMIIKTYNEEVAETSEINQNFFALLPFGYLEFHYAIESPLL